MEAPKAGDFALIGKSVVIKGDLSGSEDLYIDGMVEGNIELAGNSLTIGPNGQVKASIKAKGVTISGKLEGNVNASDRLELRKTAIVMGDIATQRVSIEEGAYIKGKVDIQKDASADTKKKPSLPGARLYTDADAGQQYLRCRRFQTCMKLFRGSSGQPPGSASTPQRLSRRSSGMGELSRLLESEEPLTVMDLGATSANNIRFFTGRGHRIYSEDLLTASLDPALRVRNEEGKSVVDTKRVTWPSKSPLSSLPPGAPALTFSTLVATSAPEPLSVPFASTLSPLAG